MLEVKNITKRFETKNKSITALENVSLNIPKGQIVGVLGVNGAGKSTLIKILCALLNQDQGEIIYDNKVLNDKNSKEIKRKINLVTGGERNLYWRLSGKENLRYFSSLYGIDKKTFDINLNYFNSLLKMDEFIERPVERCSKGQKQRIKIAKGLINNPDYLFLDEPTIGLDIEMSHTFREYIKKIAKDYNKGIVLTTHYIKEAENMCDYIYVLDKGKIVLEGTPESIKKYSNPTLKVEIEFKNNEESLLEILKNIEYEIVNNKYRFEMKYLEKIFINNENISENILTISNVDEDLEVVLLEKLRKVN